MQFIRPDPNSVFKVSGQFPPVRVRLWVRVSFRVGGQFSSRAIVLEPVFNIHDAQGITLLTRLRLGLSHLNDHKFRHNFQDCINLIYSRVHNIEITTYSLLHCPHFTCARQTIFNKINNLDSTILERNESFLTNVFRLMNKNLKPDVDKSIIMCTIEYLLSTQRFNNPLKGTLDDNLVIFFYYLITFISSLIFLLRNVVSRKNKNSGKS